MEYYTTQAGSIAGSVMEATRDAGAAEPTFRAHALVLRGRSGLTQRELSRHLGVSERAIQKWEAGLSHPSTANLQRLIALYAQRGVFVAGREEEEALALWLLLHGENAHHPAPFDWTWFASLRRPASVSPLGPYRASRLAASFQGRPAGASGLQRQDWDSAPDASGLRGRAEEMATLTHWLLVDRCRLVAILGLGGSGKTLLATHVAQQLAPCFDVVCWRSLRHAPPVEQWLAGVLRVLAPASTVPPSGLVAQLALLMTLLRERRSLLVLDNLEAILQPGERDARYRVGYEGYGDLLQYVGESRHQSCLLLTSREQSQELVLLEGPLAPVRSLRLGPLSLEDNWQLLQDRGLVGTAGAVHDLISRYGGNPMALLMVGQTIAELFGGDIEAFLSWATQTSGTVFGGVRRLLDEQFERLSALERTMVSRLAMEQEPVGVAALMADLESGATRREALEALEALRRRSLLEQGAPGVPLALPPLVREHAGEALLRLPRSEKWGDSRCHCRRGGRSKLRRGAARGGAARGCPRRSWRSGWKRRRRSVDHGPSAGPAGHAVGDAA